MAETVEQPDVAEPEAAVPTEEMPTTTGNTTETPSEESEGVEENSPATGLVSRLKKLPWKWVGVGTGALLLLSLGGLWLMSRKPEKLPGEKLQDALTLLEERENPKSQQQSYRLARELIKLNYRDPQFAGGPEYIIGMLLFREAKRANEADRELLLLRASRYLKEAESRAIESKRRSEWAYALGVSLYHIGKATEARPLLEETANNNPAHQIEVSSLLMNVYLDLKQPELLKEALALNSFILDSKELNQTEQDRTYLQRARLLLLLNRKDEVEQTLKKVSANALNNQETIVFRARTLMQEEKYQEAFQLLEPIANEKGLEQAITRKAAYFRGICAQKLGDNDAAIHLLSRTAKRYLESHEGVAASLAAGDLLRQAHRNEEALQMYRQALEQVKSREDFRNRWISSEQFRDRINKAWKEWIANHDFKEAIELSRLMSPLFLEAEAYERVAQANQHRAEFIEQELSQASYQEQMDRKEELREHWLQSGNAYARLAVKLQATTQYPDALWVSANHFTKGYHFKNARQQYILFINTHPGQRMALAHVKLGQVFMDLDRFDDAISQLEQVRANYPTHSAVYNAEYLLGLCYLEKGELKKADSIWRAILSSTELTPAANEWRLSLFSLGRLLHHSATMKFTQANSQQKLLAPDDKKTKVPPEVQTLYDTSFAQWDEAGRRLEEYLNRYPQSSQATEARFLLAKTVQYSAELPRRKLGTAETENAQKEMLRIMRNMLSQAKDEFLKLQTELLSRVKKKNLNDLEERMLHDCYFEIAHTYYALKEYDKAIIRYSGAVNRYPRDPQVLLSYLQMANCYESLNKPLESRSMFEQAKVILDGMEKKIFDPEKTSMTKEEWKKWLTVMIKLHQKNYSSSTTSSQQ